MLLIRCSQAVQQVYKVFGFFSRKLSVTQPRPAKLVHRVMTRNHCNVI